MGVHSACHYSDLTASPQRQQHTLTALQEVEAEVERLLACAAEAAAAAEASSEGQQAAA